MAKKLPGNPCAWNWGTMQRIREAIGVSGTTIPKSMHGTFKVDGWRIVVKRSAPSQRGTGKHRVFVDHDGRLVPAGRVHQALCLTKLARSRKFADKRRGEGGRFNDERGRQYRPKRRR